ncbi:hypothetical protein Sme01_08770 [Sphaerisporangium melleum]|uniref:Uncharacterized protein n=1 Tax=Sphaerisporangium melleum TaxID=321316 RepID=A0A917QWI5_9ACTN|nr:hypothetical protein [Sphaerisporangium melleum]GGK71891.1 hypothetical protein GCM10007964_13420 [Sphaerisporangium melleum]GII68401.1 hypothetical protein Sme01_08770 [Sphaerisporangium melleum]
MERRDFLRFAGGLSGAALLTSCTSGGTGANGRNVPPDGPGPATGTLGGAGGPASGGHILYASIGTRVAAIDAGTGATLFTADRPVPAPDWSRLYTVSPAGELLTLDARSGAVTARTTVPPGLVPHVVSSIGNAVALAAPPPASPYGAPAGRTATTMVIAAPDGREAPRTVRLDGNFQPDGLSAGGDALFVLQYLPAKAPESYKVKLYDMEQGKLWSLLTRDKQPVPDSVEETMRGEGRQAVLEPGYQRLYTLYTHQPDHLHTRDLVAGRTTGVHAFVHVLDLGQRWAYCLDLPEPFGRAPAAAHTLAVSAGALYVYENGHGTLVRADTSSLTITTTRTIGASAATAGAGTPSPAESGGPATGAGTGSGASAAVSGAAGDLVYLAAGQSLRAVDPRSLAVRRRWHLPAPARGVTVTEDGRAVYVGVTDAVLRFAGRKEPAGDRERRDGDAAEAARLPVPGLSLLRHAATTT